MANDEVLGPRKTMFVLVIVVGCFAVLWPRILSPLILGYSQEQLKPNQFDRDAGCCEVMFETEVAVLELVSEVCSSAIGTGGKLSPYSAAECRRAVNETCGVDMAAFLKRSENVGKTTKMLIETMKESNSSCLKEHFGVQLYSLQTHPALKSWIQQDTLKQERSPIRGMGPHPALRERGRAIPPGVPTPQAPARAPVSLPPHVRVRISPLSVYYEIENDIKPPPIPGMRPPLGSPGGPVPAPKSSMGFVMPIYTICIIVFFVYTLSKILFKRTGCPYDSVAPDPQFRRRVFRDDTRTTPDKLVVTAISGLVAEVRQQMEASDAQSRQRQDAQDNARPYTNGTILLNSGPVQIIASEFQEKKDKVPEILKDVASQQAKELISEINEPTAELDSQPQPKEAETVKGKTIIEESDKTDTSGYILQAENFENKDSVTNPIASALESESKHEASEPKEDQDASNEVYNENEEFIKNEKQQIATDKNEKLTENELSEEHKETSLEKVINEVAEVNGENTNHENLNIALSDGLDLRKDDTLGLTIEELIKEEKGEIVNKDKQSTPELLEEALKEDLPTDPDGDKENSSVKVLGMEVTTHAADGGEWQRPPAAPLPPLPAQPQRPHVAEDVKSIYLETEIPQQACVLVTEFAEKRTDRPKPQTKNSPLVVSGKMTLSLIQDAQRDTPDRDPESTVDDFTTASAMTQPAAEKEEDLSDEEIEEEIEIEEIEEEIEEEEEEEEEEEIAPETNVKIVK